MSGIIQRVRPGVSDVATFQAGETHEHRVNRNERKTKVITSFLAKYPGIFGKVTPFSELKSVQNWTNPQKEGFSDKWKETTRNERREFDGYLQIMFESHTDAYDFCHKLFEYACGWITWFLAHFLTCHEDPVRQVSPDKGSSAAIRKQCWDRVVKALRVLFNELHLVGMGARLAHMIKDTRKQTAVYLYHTLQKVRILEEFKDDEFRNHPKILANLLEHLVETYQPRDDSGLTQMGALERSVQNLTSKVNEQARDITQLRRLYNKVVEKVSCLDPDG